jgi:flagellar hook protein FlgE
MKVGDTMFAQTGNSGQAAIGSPLSGSRGRIASSSLENSNVDLSSEFVNMIVTQRGFQANSRVVTTSDEMIQELLNMKR